MRFSLRIGAEVAVLPLTVEIERGSVENIMADVLRELLTEAVARNCAVVLSLPSAGILRHYKSRFLAQATQGIWVEAIPDEHALIAELLTTKTPIGISFKSGARKIIFASSGLSVDLHYRINSDTFVPALLLASPAIIKSLQRRDNYRVRLFAGSDLAARAWRISPRANMGDRPQPSQEVALSLRDLSLGGIGISLHPIDGRQPIIDVDDRLRIEIRFNETVLLLEGRMRPTSGPQPAGVMFTGIRFNELGGDFEGRQKLTQLTRIVGEMQREEVRRARLGLD